MVIAKNEWLSGFSPQIWSMGKVICSDHLRIKAGHIILSWIHALPKMINICRRKGRYFTHIDTLCKYCKPIWTVIGSIFDPLSIENFSLFFVKCKDWEFKYLQAIEFTCYWTWQCIVKIIAKHMSFHFLLICLYKLFGRRIYYKSAVNFWPIEFTSIHYQLSDTTMSW